ncbi:MAG: amidase [Burkholderiales bacterium]
MPLYQLGLIEATTSIAQGRLSAADYLESCIARTLAVAPSVKPFAYFDASAVRAAKASPGPLAGMPIGFKDIMATRGIPTEMGSAAFEGHVPAQSAWVVDALQGAGALVFGKTVTTEFAWRHPGKTHNPWSLAHTPGGSSSGSAAAVACGCVPAALGTQTVGSVLRPAAYCGVVGYKPSFGITPRTGIHAFSPSLDHVGVFARCVADAAWLASFMTGRDGIDFWGTPAPTPAWPLAQSGPAPRIALLRSTVWQRISPEQQQLVESTAQRLVACGASVTSVELPPSLEALWACVDTLVDVEGGASNAALADAMPQRISPVSLALVERGRKVLAADYFAARQLQQALIRAFAAWLAPFDVALMAPALGEAPVGLANTGDASLCALASLVGAPAIALPAGISGNQLPLGIQLVGRWGNDRGLLEAAIWVEQQLAYRSGFPLP